MDATITPPLASIGIDIGKEVFHVVGFGADGKISFRRKIKRLALAATFSKRPLGARSAACPAPCRQVRPRIVPPEADQSRV